MVTTPESGDQRQTSSSVDASHAGPVTSVSIVVKRFVAGSMRKTVSAAVFDPHRAGGEDESGGTMSCLDPLGHVVRTRVDARDLTNGVVRRPDRPCGVEHVLAGQARPVNRTSDDLAQRLAGTEEAKEDFVARK